MVFQVFFSSTHSTSDLINEILSPDFSFRIDDANAFRFIHGGNEARIPWEGSFWILSAVVFPFVCKISRLGTARSILPA